MSPVGPERAFLRSARVPRRAPAPESDLPRGVLLPRRALAPALLGSAALLGSLSGCGPSPVPTSADIAKDPLASLDPELWNARSAEELLALTVRGDIGNLDAWTDLGGDEAVLDGVRGDLVAFIEACYLTPESLRGLDDQATYERLAEAAPEAWKDDLEDYWSAENRPFYAFSLKEPFRSVGRPAMCATWYRSEDASTPQLLLGMTLAWTVIDSSTHDVGVIASRLGFLLNLETSGAMVDGDLSVTLHGMDGCAITEAKGLLVPAISGEDSHRKVQDAVWTNVLDAPAIPLKDVKDPESPLFAGEQETFLDCR